MNFKNSKIFLLISERLAWAGRVCLPFNCISDPFRKTAMISEFLVDFANEKLMAALCMDNVPLSFYIFYPVTIVHESGCLLCFVLSLVSSKVESLKMSLVRL